MVDQQAAMSTIRRKEIRDIRDRTIPAIIFLSKIFKLRTSGANSGWYYNLQPKQNTMAAELAHAAFEEGQPPGPETKNLLRLTEWLREGKGQEGEMRIHYKGIHRKEQGGAWGVMVKWWESEARTALLWRDFGRVEARDAYEAEAKAAARAADMAAQILFGIQDGRWIQHHIRTTT